MTTLTWLFFSMTGLIFFILGRRYQRWTDKELRRLAKEIIEESRKKEAKEEEEKGRSIWNKDY